MGLDTVELVMEVEEEFGITIPDRDAGSIRTVGELHEYVAARIDPAPGSRCLSAATFYHLRRSLPGPLGLACDRLRPSTPTAELIPRDGRRSAWRSVEQQLGWRLPPLKRPRWLVRTLEGVVCLLFLASLLACVTDRISAEGLIAIVLIQVAALVPKAVLLARLTEPFATRIPPGCESVRDLVGSALMLNFAVIRRQAGFPPAPAEIFEKIRAVVSEQLGVPPEQITPVTRFVEDLGAG